MKTDNIWINKYAKEAYDQKDFDKFWDIWHSFHEEDPIPWTIPWKARYLSKGNKSEMKERFKRYYKELTEDEEIFAHAEVCGQAVLLHDAIKIRNRNIIRKDGCVDIERENGKIEPWIE